MGRATAALVATAVMLVGCSGDDGTPDDEAAAVEDFVAELAAVGRGDEDTSKVVQVIQDLCSGVVTPIEGNQFFEGAEAFDFLHEACEDEALMGADPDDY